MVYGYTYFIGAWRSWFSAPAWGAGGRPFKSDRPDYLMATILLLTILTTYNPVAIDSAIYHLDNSGLKVDYLKLSGEIIDYLKDDFLYVLTSRYIYKIDREGLFICDQTLLPQRYNYLALTSERIILISSSEFILLNRKNLSFIGGVGIESADYRPLFNASLPGEDHLYLITDSGERSIVKLFDINTGKKIRQIILPKVICHKYEKGKLIISNKNNQLMIFDLNLKKIGEIKLQTPAEDFYLFNGLILATNRSGVFLFSDKGVRVDFQPVTLEVKWYDNLTFLSSDRIILIDSLALRIKSILPNDCNLTKIFRLDERRKLGINKENSLFLIDKKNSMISRVELNIISAKLPSSPFIKDDSLYYIQFGAFRKLTHAISLFDSLNSMGIPAFIDSTDLYRVKLGGFFDKRGAIEILEESRLNGWIGYQKKIAGLKFNKFCLNNNRYTLKDGIITKE